MSKLTKNDIPGAALRGRNPTELKVPELKRWSICRGALVKGKKADLIVSYCLSRPCSDTIDESPCRTDSNSQEYHRHAPLQKLFQNNVHERHPLLTWTFKRVH